LYDMMGNVRELTGDWYGDYPSGKVTKDSPAIKLHNCYRR
jgi:formylglycine-generating enzyme required for sulfatase activity